MHAIEVQDRASSGRGAEVEAALRATAERFAKAGHALRRPVRGVLEKLGVEAFTETQAERHVLHLRAEAAAQPWLQGLLAREVAHAVLGDEGHASHDPALLQAGFAAARARTRDLHALSVVASLNHHVRDAYADDLAHRVAPAELEPFLAHVAQRAAATQGTPLEVAVEAGYAAGTLTRRGALAPPALAAVLRESAAARRLADGFAGLHPEPEEADLHKGLAQLVERLLAP